MSLFNKVHLADLAGLQPPAAAEWNRMVERTSMHDDKTVQRFIELRSQGWPFARISSELNVSKPTLIN